MGAIEAEGGTALGAVRCTAMVWQTPRRPVFVPSAPAGPSPLGPLSPTCVLIFLFRDRFFPGDGPLGGPMEGNKQLKGRLRLVLIRHAVLA